MISRKMAFSIQAIIFVLLICACGTSIHPTRPIATPTQIPTSDQSVMGDCWHTFELSAWQDSDGDGLWGKSEFPLESVRFDIIAGPVAEVRGYPPLSNAEGQLDMEIWHPGGCFDETYTITAQPPESYQPTTPTSVTFLLKPYETEYKWQFGFRPMSK